MGYCVRNCVNFDGTVLGICAATLVSRVDRSEGAGQSEEIRKKHKERFEDYSHIFQ
jgi:hypothetical protein